MRTCEEHRITSEQVQKITKTTQFENVLLTLLRTGKKAERLKKRNDLRYFTPRRGNSTPFVH